MKKILLCLALMMIAVCIGFLQTPASENLSLTFLDVGQGDACILECNGEYAILDGGSVSMSSTVYSYLKSHGIHRLKYMIATHPHEDHIGGLSGALNYARVDQIFCSCDAYDSPSFYNLLKYSKQQGLSIQVPSPGTTLSLGKATIEVIGPIIESENVNDTCLVLRVTHGNNVFLFMADAERDEELSLVDAGILLSATVVKIGHHGSSDATTYPFLRETMPTYAVISCGADNPYGHPTEETLSKLRDANVKVFRTDMQGSITMESNGESILIQTERNYDIDTLGMPERNTEGTYVLNTRTMKFHLPECSNAKDISLRNRREYTGNRMDLIMDGYSPCGVCKP